MIKINSKGLARALKIAREKLGETQEQFAARAGVDQATISRWEIKGPRTGPGVIAARQILAKVEGFLPSE
jgi:transcriptional regulator with XRE-family HTH domain